MPNRKFGDAPCPFKNTVVGIKTRSFALQKAEKDHEDPNVFEELGRLIKACDDALAYVRRPPGYPEGRLESSASEVATDALTAFETKYPQFKEFFSQD